MEAITLQQHDGRYGHDDCGDRSGSQGRRPGALAADLNNQGGALRLDSEMLKGETRGQIGGAAELADADSLALQLRDRPALLLRHQIVHGAIGGVKYRFDGRASPREPQPRVGEPMVLNVSRHQRVLRLAGSKTR